MKNTEKTTAVTSTTASSYEIQDWAACPPETRARLNSIDKTQLIEKELCGLVLNDFQSWKICEKLLEEFDRGLKKRTHKDATIKMLNTYVQSLPNGSEKGWYLALDLGGTNFRTLLIHKTPNHYSLNVESFTIPENIMSGSAEELFDHIVDCLHSFLSKQNAPKQRIPMGFTFSYPIIQDSLRQARLIRWTKGFTASGVVGEDVVGLLNRSLEKRKDINVDVVVLLNDTTGTLAACALTNGSCKIGLILGTGSNMCYQEKVENVEKWDSPPGDHKHVLINTEWGAFGDNGCLDFIRTDFDKEVDRLSTNPGEQTFEKMISGMYMGEIVRVILVRLTKRGLIFDGHLASSINTPGTFLTKYISDIERLADDDYSGILEVLKLLDLHNVTVADCILVRNVCSYVSRRSAHLAAAGIATVLNKLNRSYVTVAVDGSLYKLHPHYHKILEARISQLIRPGTEFELRLSEDGSGIGAAILAASVDRDLRNKNDGSTSD